jgi:hypothetical protein
VLDFSITKMRGISIKVTVIGVPCCVSHLLLGFGFSKTTIYVITRPIMYLERLDILVVSISWVILYVIVM